MPTGGGSTNSNIKDDPSQERNEFAPKKDLGKFQQNSQGEQKQNLNEPSK